MKAGVVHAKNDIRYEEIQKPEVEPGKVLIAFPEDAHMVKIQWGESCPVEKAVVKVLFRD